MKIDFTKFNIYTDISHTKCIEANVKDELANVLYNNGSGIACHALALKIYNTKGEEEYTDEEYNILLNQMQASLTPMFTSSLMEYNKKEVES